MRGGFFFAKSGTGVYVPGKFLAECWNFPDGQALGIFMEGV